MTFITYEDRQSDCIGLKLLAASILRGGAGHKVICICPGSFAAFREWAVRFPQLMVRDSEDLGVTGWEVKPTLLLRALDEGVEQPIWIDSDIIMSRPVGETLFEIAGDDLLATEENSSHAHIDVDRAKLSGLTSTRRLKKPLNTGVLRVSAVHRPLLHAWAERMGRADFQNAQRDLSAPRPTHLAGDQDVLEALLCSSDYCGIPVRQLRAGIDIAQCWWVFGYAFHHRLRALFLGLPPIVHALGVKPWRVTGNSLAMLATELHPYNRVARKFADDVQEDISWTRPHSTAARILTLLGSGSIVLPGMYLQIQVALYQLLVSIAQGLRKRGIIRSQPQLRD